MVRMQAAESLSSLFTELSLWARAMPQYADELCAVAAGALNVLDERCAALLDGVLQQVRPRPPLLTARVAHLSASSTHHLYTPRPPSCDASAPPRDAALPPT